MAFRSDRQANPEWRQFLKQFQVRLTAAGIPEEAFKTRRSWLYFIEHVYLDDHPELLNLENWPEDRLASLLPIFEEIEDRGYYAGEGAGVLGWLRRRTGNNG